MSGTVVVGIAGGSGSGKSTYTREVINALGPSQVSSLAHDSYYLPLPERLRSNPHVWNFDAPEALDTALLVRHLDELVAGRAVEVPRYDFASHDRRGTERVEPAPVVIVEGILALAEPELRRRFDHAVFVSAPEHVRLGRRIRRDEAERGRTLDDVLQQYFETVRPSHERWVEPCRDVATLLIDGTGPISDGVRSLLSVLGSAVRLT